ncbi:MAG: RHS repeat-associated core domain-containing protein [Flavobacterium sp.]|nr:RHS repeat-associated core domain-containing protein [Flavobacterium sp.]
MAQQLGSNYYNSPYKFNGKELDEETGLSYFGARYYNPKWSIWLSVDPLAEKYPNVSPYTYCLNNPINFIDPDGRDVIVWHVYDVVNGGMTANRGYASKKFNQAMKHFAKTDYGKSFLLQFMKKGQSIYGVTAKENGKHSDKNLNLHDLTLEKASPSERGAVFVESDGTVWEGMTVFPDSKEDMSLNVYFANVNGENSTTELGETIAHELGLHGNKYEQYIDAILKGKSFKNIQSGSKDHDGLKKSDIKNKSYQIYKKIMEQLIKINSNYKIQMEDDKKRNHN